MDRRCRNGKRLVTLGQAFFHTAIEARDAVLDDGGLIRSVWLNTEGSETSGHGGLPGPGSLEREGCTAFLHLAAVVWLAQP